jgi:MoaA/NifB/PqqE/SkfB family radical SAM enzyme
MELKETSEFFKILGSKITELESSGFNIHYMCSGQPIELNEFLAKFYDGKYGPDLPPCYGITITKDDATWMSIGVSPNGIVYNNGFVDFIKSEFDEYLKECRKLAEQKETLL